VAKPTAPKPISNTKKLAKAGGWSLDMGNGGDKLDNDFEKF